MIVLPSLPLRAKNRVDNASNQHKVKWTMVERPHLFRISRCKTLFVIGHLEWQAESSRSCTR
jgi:hypothetical protein